jgi:outer membrane protein assembly factor BamB
MISFRPSLLLWIAALAVSVTLNAGMRPWAAQPLATLLWSRHGALDNSEPARQPPPVERLDRPMLALVSAPNGRHYTIGKQALSAEEADGRIAWSFTPPPPSSRYAEQEMLGAAPIVGDDGTVYVATQTTLRAFTEEGEIKWSSPEVDRQPPDNPLRAHGLNKGIVGPIAVAPGSNADADAPMIYVGSDTGIWAYTLDGRIVWRSTVMGRQSRLMLAGDRLYASYFDELAALRIADGFGIWKRKVAGIHSLFARGTDGTLYAGGDRLIALTAGGDERWSRSFEARVTGVAIAGHRLLVSAGALYCLRPDGAEIWRFRPPDLIMTPPRIPVVPGQPERQSEIVVVAGRTNILAVDMNGRLQWRLPNPDGGFSKQPPSLFAEPDGSIVAAQGSYNDLAAIRIKTGADR